MSYTSKDINFEITLDGITHQLTGNIEQGIVLPVQTFKEISIAWSMPFSIVSDNICSAPILMLEDGELHIMRGIYQDSIVLHEFSELYMKIPSNPNLHIS